MKKILALVLVLAIAISLVPVAIATDEVVAAQGINMFAGGDFNSESVGTGNFKHADWYNNEDKSTSLTWYADKGPDGSGCIGLDVGGGNNCIQYDPWPTLRVGHTYKLTCDVFIPENSVEYMQADYQGQWPLEDPNATTYTIGSWVRLENTFTVSEQQDYAMLRIFGPAVEGYDGNAEILFDNISLIDIYSDNLMLGGDFESQTVTGLKYFYNEGYGSNRLTYYAEGGVNGSGCVGIGVVEPGKNFCMMVHGGAPVENGKTYMMSCDVYIPAGTAEWITMDFEADPLSTWANQANFPRVSTTDSWQHIVAYFTVPADYGFPQLRIYGPSLANADIEKEILIDNVSLRCTDPSVEPLYGGSYDEDLKGVNLLYNGDFERSGWSYNREDWSSENENTGGRFDWNATAGVDGSGAWVGTPGTNAKACMVIRPADKEMNLDSYALYEFSAKVYRENTDAIVYISPRIANGAAYTNSESFWTTQYGVWEEVSVKFWATWIDAVNFWVRAENYTYGTVKIDDVALRQLGVEERFDVVGFDKATITNIGKEEITAQLDFGTKMWLGCNVMICEQPSTSGCNEGNTGAYQFVANQLIPGADAEYKDGKVYASTWTAVFPRCTCEWHADLWNTGKPDNCVIRITDYMGEDTQNATLDERMVIAANVACGINGERIAAEQFDAGMDLAWRAPADPGVVQVDGVAYDSLATALSEATDGQVVTLAMDATETEMVVVPAGVTLDLKGHALTANIVNAFGDIKDSTEGVGGIKIAKNDTNDGSHIILTTENSMLPLYDTVFGGYRFFTCSVNHLVDGNGYRFGYQMEMADAAYALLSDSNADGVLDADLTLVTNLVIDVDNGQKTAEVPGYKFTAGTLATYGDKMTNEKANWAITLNVSGFDKVTFVDSIKITSSAPVVQSSTGVQIGAGEAAELSFTYTK